MGVEQEKVVLDLLGQTRGATGAVSWSLAKGRFRLGAAALIGGDGAAAHGERCGDGGQEAGDDEAGAAGGFGDEHDCGEWYSVAGAEERGDADDHEESLCSPRSLARAPASSRLRRANSRNRADVSWRVNRSTPIPFQSPAAANAFAARRHASRFGFLPRRDTGCGRAVCRFGCTYRRRGGLRRGREGAQPPR